MNSVAYLIKSDDNYTDILTDIVSNSGFHSVLPYSGLSAVEQQIAKTPVCFFLFAQLPDITMASDVIGELRKCKRRGVRFSPLIYFCQTPSREVIRGCVSMGFDDVISLPLTGDEVGERLLHQIGRTLTYFETDTYFGPDRRHTDSIKKEIDRRTGKAMFRRYEFTRDLSGGISITSNRLVAA